jgi:hypothetical protein
VWLTQRLCRSKICAILQKFFDRLAIFQFARSRACSVRAASGSEDRLGRLSGLRFESLCLYRSALIVGGKLKHPSLHCLAKECLSLTPTRFSARPVSLAGRDKDSLVHWQFASPSRGSNGPGEARERKSSGPTRRVCDSLVSNCLVLLNENGTVLERQFWLRGLFGEF